MAWWTGRKAARGVALAAQVLAVVLAGCGSPAGQEAAAPEGGASGLGSIEGVVVSQAIAPLPGATVGLSPGNATATTGADGAFRFGGLAPGSYTLLASLEGYVPVTVAAATGDALVHVVLEPDTAALRYVESYAHEGFVETSVNLAGVRSSNTVAPNFTFEGRLPDFVQVEMAWTSTQALGDEMDLTLVRNDGGTLVPDVGHAEGPSPLAVSLDAAAIRDPELGFGPGIVLDLFIFAGEGEVAGGAGAGAAVQQPFMVFTHVFHGYAPPEGWLFTRDGEAPPP